MEKKDGKTETLVDFFTSQNSAEGDLSSGIHRRRNEEKSSLFGGGKRSKSEEGKKEDVKLGQKVYPK